MALIARLQFGDNDAKVYPREYLVEDCKCHFSRTYNHFHPNTDARCERLELTVVAPGKEDLNLYDWYLLGEPLSGRIVFDMPTLQAAEDFSKEIMFDSAYCYALSEDYHIDGSSRRCLRLQIVADNISVSDILFKNIDQ